MLTDNPEFGEPYSFRLDELRDAAEAANRRWWIGRTVRQPIDREPCLYHYTSAEGLAGILQSRALWATDTAFLNDWKEIGYAADPLVQRMAAALEDNVRPFFPNGRVELPVQNPQSFPLKPGMELYERLMVLGAARSMIDHFTGPNRAEIVRGNDLYLRGATFVSCLSKDHDQLGQWRGYGKGGYAIGFRRDALAGSAPILGAVQYGESAIKALCDRVIEHFASIEIAPSDGYQLGQSDGHPAERVGYVEAVSFCLPQVALVKHEAFAQENEWRLVVPRYDLDYSNIKVRAIGGRLIPYVECPFEDDAISEIVIGPGGDLHSERAVLALLAANEFNPDKVQIAYSAAPFRG